jgi:hypothetical protein
MTRWERWESRRGEDAIMKPNGLRGTAFLGTAVSGSCATVSSVERHLARDAPAVAVDGSCSTKAAESSTRAAGVCR